MSLEELSSLGLSIIPDFITAEEELELLNFIGPANAKGKTSGRNTIKRYGSALPYSSNMVSSAVPEQLDKYCQKLVDAKLLDIKPDSVTVNEYLQGQVITPHIDSKSSGAVITVLSLKSEATMVLTKGKCKQSVVLLPRMLLQMKDDIRNKWMHSVDPVKDIRYSIVFRLGTSISNKKSPAKKFGIKKQKSDDGQSIS